MIYDHLFPPPDVKQLLDADKVPISKNASDSCSEQLQDYHRDLHPRASSALVPLLTCRLIEQEAWKQAFRNTIFSTNVSKPMNRYYSRRLTLPKDPDHLIFKNLHDISPATRNGLRHIQLNWHDTRTVVIGGHSDSDARQWILETEKCRMLHKLQSRVPLELAELGLQLDPATESVTEWLQEEAALDTSPEHEGRPSFPRAHLRLFLVYSLQVRPCETRIAEVD